jgi:alpha-L-rhamnosidase
MHRHTLRHISLSLLCVATLFASSVLPAAATSIPNASGGLWSTNPNWRQYVETPRTRDLHPVRVISTSGNVSNAGALTQSGRGVATLTRSASDTTATNIVLDYGKDIGGIPRFEVAGASGNPTLEAGYSETLAGLSATGDGANPLGEGDPNRFDTYTVSSPGLITNRYVQGGERYQEISLTSVGSISLRSVEIYYEAGMGDYKGYFVSSSDELNKIWYSGVYTVQLDQIPAGTPNNYWEVQNGSLDIVGDNPSILSSDLNMLGGNSGFLRRGASWKDYTTSFRVAIQHSEASWIVRGSENSNGYVFILGASNDSSAPNELQEYAVDHGTITPLGTVKLSFTVQAGTWYQVQTQVSGTTLITSINGQQVASVDTTSVSGAPNLTSGTVGFREGGGFGGHQEAYFSDLKIADAQGRVLYANALSQERDLNDFITPNAARGFTILDGAKRDRLVWIGDLGVTDPTLFVSTDESEYARDSLALLGSYQYQNGYVTGCISPTVPIGLSLLSGPNGCYSATYSMWFVTNLANYYLYTGDKAFLRQEWAAAQRELAWSKSQVDSNGLFATNSSDGRNWNLELHTGEVTEVNDIYYATLVGGAWLAQQLGDSSAASSYQQQATALRQQINGRLWNATLGAYGADNHDLGVLAQDANVLAIEYGIADPTQTASILAAMDKTLSSPYGTLSVANGAPVGTGFGSEGWRQDISPYIGSFELWTRFAHEDSAGAFKLMNEEWGLMVNGDPGGTDVERLTTTGQPNPDAKQTSFAHGWATGATSALSNFVLGVQPVDAGYRTWLVEPHTGDLSWVEGQVPTPHGLISVRWGQQTSASNKKLFSMEVTAPGSTSGTIAVPLEGLNAVVAVNGLSLRISNGHLLSNQSQIAGISKIGINDSYLDLTVQGGTYTITSQTTGK